MQGLRQIVMRCQEQIADIQDGQSHAHAIPIDQHHAQIGGFDRVLLPAVAMGDTQIMAVAGDRRKRGV
jgi:hypothetical protein